MLPPELMRASPLRNTAQAFGYLKCPRWLRSKLLFLDVHRRRIYSIDTSGTVHAEMDLPFVPAALAVLSSGQVMVADAWRQILYQLVGERRERVAIEIDDVRACPLQLYCLHPGV